MTIFNKPLVAVVLGLALATPVFANGYYGDDPQGSFAQRAETQRARVALGLKRGLLTPDEAQVLYGDQDRLAAMEQDFRANGYLSPRDRAELNRAYNDASYRIFRLKHNLNRQLPGWYRTYGTYGGYDDRPYRDEERHVGYNDGLDDELWWR
jgi:hypothetical protein